MMFTDIIRTADSEHEIYFLLTSYIDALRSSSRLDSAPESLTRLPLSGWDDVKNRFDKLMLELDTASKRLNERGCVVIKEALHILGTALNRLVLIDEERGRAASPFEAGRAVSPFDATALAPAAGVDNSIAKGPRKAVAVLLVEDNPGDVRMTEKALEVTGVPYHLHVVKDGDEAMSYLCQAGKFDNAPKPDVVLVDLSIPRLDAAEVLNEIRNSDALKHVPIVALTCSIAERHIQRSRHANADHFVVKPLGVGALVNEMRKIDVLAARHLKAG
jgi:chemotaxis family two-component system response regulator Rcp1